ncbi:MAG TPA: acriflavine resistance protein B [Verrucomicrobia bacterium]|nr:MAG: hypothetical protein A2X46_08285 [Lentisphaerae bacterium GWF2_57_35]HBA83689.1 acriflavine resistance protein B [Verrucomicrobiota bacterium]
MNISDRFIDKPIMTTLVMVVIIAFGVVSYTKLPISSLPSVDYPVLQITAYYPGASPATMASTVASPLESECMQINGLESIISDNESAQTTITLTFSLNRPVDLVAPDVQAAISRAQNNLPSDLPSPPTYSKNNPSDKPILFLNVSSDTMNPGDLYDYANRYIAKRINMIEGVSKVDIYGSKTAIRIKIYPEKLASFQLGLDEIAAVLKTGTASIPGGQLNGDYRAFSIEPQGQLLKAKDYGQLIVAYRNGRPIRLSDVAACVDSVNNEWVDIRYGDTANGKVLPKCVFMAISRVAGANTVALSQRIQDTLDGIRKQIPASIALDVFYDGAEPIKESISDVEQTIVIAIALVVIIIFLFLGRIRETLIPSITLPIAILATFIIMLASNFSLDILSLMALVLSVGFLVDDAIVVLENTVRHIEAGLPPIQAAKKSMGEISTTVISTSVALVIVFVPLVFMGGVVGRNFKEFALTVIYAIVASTLLALTLTPMMCSRILKAEGGKHKTRIQEVIDRVIGGLIESYGRMLHWTLRHKIISLLIWAACIAGTLGLFMILPKSFLPPGDSGLVMGMMVMPQGVTTEQMAAYERQVSAVLLQHPAMEKVLTVIGFNSGADQSQGYVYAKLKPAHDRPSIDDAIDDMQKKLYPIPNGMTFLMAMPVLKLSAGGEATAMGSKYSYTLRGNDRDQLYSVAAKLEQKMRTLPGFIGIQSSVKLNLPQLDIHLYRDRASTLGLTAKDIEYALALAYAGGRVTTYHTDNDQYDVVAQLDDAKSKLPADLSSIYMRSSLTGKLVPLSSVADWIQDVGPVAVPHSQQMDSATLSFSLAPDMPLGNATKALTEAARAILPPEISGALQGEAQEFEEAVSSLAFLMLVAIFLMYIVLGILYESYIHPFTVLTTLPVAAFGGLGALVLFHQELSLYAYIGIFMLLGIIAKNGIMMVDFAIQEKEAGKNSFDAIYNACLIRFRPILMTGISSIMGAMPIAVGYGADGASRIPLGLIIVGGLAFAQIITLFVTPGIFLYMDVVQKRFASHET